MNIFDGDVLEWDGKHKRSNIMHPRQVSNASAQWRSWKLEDQMPMKFESQKIQPAQSRINRKHTLLGILLGTVLAISACAVSTPDNTANLSPEDKMLRHKYRGIYGGVLYFDASGYRKGYLTMHTQSGEIWHASIAGVSWGAQQMTFTGAMYIPKTLRVVWRTGDVRVREDEKGRSNYHTMGFDGGTILGDYTVPVTERIPDEILDYIRKNGGALRLKIRLKDDGVLIGWDVEERVPIPNLKPGERAQNFIRYVLPGGDF